MLHTPFPRITEAALEALNDAHVAFMLDECGRTESRMLDAAIACGMDRDHVDLSGWVAERIGAWLTSGGCEEDYCTWCDTTVERPGDRFCGPCAAEYRAERSVMSETL